MYKVYYICHTHTAKALCENSVKGAGRVARDITQTWSSPRYELSLPAGRAVGARTV